MTNTDNTSDLTDAEIEAATKEIGTRGYAKEVRRWFSKYIWANSIIALANKRIAASEAEGWGGTRRSQGPHNQG